jgi:hypothetical protein
MVNVTTRDLPMLHFARSAGVSRSAVISAPGQTKSRSHCRDIRCKSFIISKIGCHDYLYFEASAVTPAALPLTMAAGRSQRAALLSLPPPAHLPVHAPAHLPDLGPLFPSAQ